MPHVRVRAMTEANVKKLSLVLPQELSLLMGTPEDNFTVEKVASIFYRKGEPVADGEGDPMVEIHWFDRGAEVKATVAKRVTEIIRGFSQSEYITVVFFDLPREDYFENGSHF